jgi:hypothetical protein
MGGGCMGEECSSGMMAPDIKATTIITKSTVMENILIHKGRYLRETGKTECGTAVVN